MNDSHDKYDLVCKQFGSLKHSDPPMRVDWMPSVAWNLLFEWSTLNGVCLVYLQVENEIGIAKKNRRGYTSTPCVIREGVDGGKAVDWFNEYILNLSKDEAYDIILSTM